MIAVEFQAKIKNGIIEIPEIYRERFREQVRVILLAEEMPAESDMIEHLLSNPLKIEGFKLLTREEIYAR